MGELVTKKNISFLSDTEEAFRYRSAGGEDQTYLAPPFAAGHVYTSSMLDTLVCQAYYNPHIITILRLLVAGEDPQASDAWNDKMAARVGGAVMDSHLFQIPVSR